MRVGGAPFGLGIDKSTELADTRSVPVALGNTTPSSGCPASLLVRVICCSLVIAVPLLRLLVSRASDRADSADRDQETSPDESEHPKHCEHTKKRRNGGAGATRIREFS